MVDHVHNILAIGVVTKDPVTIPMKNGNNCGRFEIECKRTYKIKEKIEEKTEEKTQKYVVVTYTKNVLDSVFSSIRVGATVAVNGEHACIERTTKTGTKFTSNEITVPSLAWGGAIRILENIDSTAVCTPVMSKKESDYCDDIPF